MKNNNFIKIYDRLAGHVFGNRPNREIISNCQNPGECFNDFLNKLMHRFMIVALMAQKGVPEIGGMIARTRAKGNEWQSYQELFAWVDNVYPGKIFAPHPLDNLTLKKEMITELVDFLLGVDDSELIVYAHEKLISRSFSLSGDKVTVEENLQRKNSGVFYTPPYIIKYIIKQTLIPQLNCIEKSLAGMKQFKILDPSCGSGVFLTAAIVELADFYRRAKLIALDELPLFIARNNLRGIDNDPIAVEFCVYNLLTALGEKDFAKSRQVYQELLKGIQRADFLQWATHGQDSFNLIIGNPPFVSGRKILPAQKKLIRENFHCATGQFDLIVPFVEGALKILKKGGKLSFILPNKYLAADFGYELRKNIVQNYSLEQLTDLSTIKVFKAAAVYPVIQVIGIPLTKGAEKKVLISKLKLDHKSTLSVIKQGQIPQDFFAVDNFNLSPEICPESYPVLNKIRQQKKRIPSDKILCGIAQSGFGKNIIAQGKFKDLSGEPGNYKRILQASDIMPYKIGPNYKYIINSAASPGKWEEFDGVKLVVPGIAKKLMSAVDRQNSALGRLYFIREGTVPWDLYFLLGLFNSAVVNFYYHILFWPVHQSGGYLRMNSTYLAQIPIPDGFTEIQSEISNIARTINQGVSDGNLAELTARIDSLVGVMYGLNSEDIKFINSYNTGG